MGSAGSSLDSRLFIRASATPEEAATWYKACGGLACREQFRQIRESKLARGGPAGQAYESDRDTEITSEGLASSSISALRGVLSGYVRIAFVRLYMLAHRLFWD